MLAPGFHMLALQAVTVQAGLLHFLSPTEGILYKFPPSFLFTSIFPDFMAIHSV